MKAKLKEHKGVIYFMLLLLQGLIISCIGINSSLQPLEKSDMRDPWIGQFLLLPPGYDVEVIEFWPDEHNNLIGISDEWLVIMELDSENRGVGIIAHGDLVWNCEIFMGQPTGYDLGVDQSVLIEFGYSIIVDRSWGAEL